MAKLARPRAIAAVFTRDTPSNRLLRFALGSLAAIGCIPAVRNILLGYPFGADAEIPLRAAARWAQGGAPYLASAFSRGPGYDLPYLYPPYLLPSLVPLVDIPRLALEVGWAVLLIAVAASACLRLGLPLWIAAATLFWPPFFEGLAGGNVQILVFAAYVWLFFRPAGHGAMTIDPASDDRPRLVRVALLATTFLVKITQAAPFMLVMRRRRRLALDAVLVGVGLIVATLPFTGVGLWAAWIDQTRRAADPTWVIGGQGLTHYLPTPIALGVAALSVFAVFVVPIQTAGEWVGVLSVVGAPSLHTFGLLFLLPAMVRIRREVGYVTALFIATYTEPGWWLAISFVAIGLLVAERFPLMRENTRIDESVPGAFSPVAIATSEP